jgi:glycosyltransferase involved in cell wall biosynthesis
MPLDQPQVSVIVPIYNVESYLEDCLDSLTRQTFGDFEAVLINDGSTDHSLAIAERFSASDPRIVIHTTPNRGLSEARNHGVDRAKGEFITFLDADDLLDPSALEVAIDNCTKLNLDLFFYTASSFYGDDKTETFNDPYFRRSADVIDRVMKGREFLVRGYESDSLLPSACLFLVRRAIANQLSFFPGIYHEDNLYMARLLLSHDLDAVMATNDTLYKRRLREGSITAQFSLKHASDYLAVHGELLNLKRENGDDEIRKSIDWLASEMLLSASNSFRHLGGGKLEMDHRLTLLRLLAKTPQYLFSIKHFSRLIFPRQFHFLRLLLSGGDDHSAARK